MSIAATVTVGCAGVALGPAFGTTRPAQPVATLAAPVRLAGAATVEPTASPIAVPTANPTASPTASPTPTDAAAPTPVTHPAAQPEAATAAPKPAYARRHPLPTVTEPGVGGATWNVLQGWADPIDWRTRGTVVSTTVSGAGTGLSEPAYVYLPPAYFQPTNALDATGRGRRDLPMTVVFTGYPGDNGHLITRQHYPETVAAGIASGTVAQTVLLMISPDATFPWDTECSNIPGGPQAFTFYSQEAPDAAATEFGLRPDAYAAIGDSTGGYCAAKLESMDPSRFAVAVALSGYFTPATDKTTRGTFADKSLRNANDLGWRLAHRPVPDVQLLLATAQDERGADGYATNQAWMRLVRAPMRADELVLAHGGHNSDSWSREIPYAMSWISNRLPHDHVRAAAAPSNSRVATSNGTAQATQSAQPTTVARPTRTRRRSGPGM